MRPSVKSFRASGVPGWARLPCGVPLWYDCPVSHIRRASAAVHAHLGGDMDIRVSKDPLRSLDGDLLAVFAFAQPEPLGRAAAAVDAALGGAISELGRAGDWSGKAEETSLLYTRGALGVRRVLVVGLGARSALGWRRCGWLPLPRPRSRASCASPATTPRCPRRMGWPTTIWPRPWWRARCWAPIPLPGTRRMMRRPGPPCGGSPSSAGPKRPVRWPPAPSADGSSVRR